MKKTTKRKQNRSRYYILGGLILVIIALIIGATVKLNVKKDEIELVISETQVEPVYENDLGEIEEDVLTVEEVDGGGMFKDNLNAGEGEKDFYYELGAIEQVDTSSPEAFKNSTIGRCIIANNYYGAQCVSLARAFWWGYAGYDVSTCGTGLAKGMMNCSEENARDRFKVIWNRDEIQNGTWLVLDGSRTGHICMALGKPHNGYVSCLGENQGGVPCEYGVGGAGTNIINISLKNFIGGYTPVDYIIPEPEPEPTPLSPDTGRK